MRCLLLLERQRRTLPVVAGRRLRLLRRHLQVLRRLLLLLVERMVPHCRRLRLPVKGHRRRRGAAGHLLQVADAGLDQPVGLSLQLLQAALSLPGENVHMLLALALHARGSVLQPCLRLVHPLSEALLQRLELLAHAAGVLVQSRVQSCLQARALPLGPLADLFDVCELLRKALGKLAEARRRLGLLLRLLRQTPLHHDAVGHVLREPLRQLLQAAGCLRLLLQLLAHVRLHLLDLGPQHRKLRNTGLTGLEPLTLCLCRAGKGVDLVLALPEGHEPRELLHDGIHEPGLAAQPLGEAAVEFPAALSDGLSAILQPCTAIFGLPLQGF
mmetsp:Transcript_55738/g.173266  ORF Transcript_55738/g.173266 Transcript_55738/m.173266 type:complete len:328 (-) Transcript_55738:368-1351(-)